MVATCSGISLTISFVTDRRVSAGGACHWGVCMFSAAFRPGENRSHWYVVWLGRHGQLSAIVFVRAQCCARLLRLRLDNPCHAEYEQARKAPKRGRVTCREGAFTCVLARVRGRPFEHLPRTGTLQSSDLIADRDQPAAKTLRSFFSAPS